MCFRRLKCSDRNTKFKCPTKPKISSVKICNSDGKVIYKKYSVYCTCKTLDCWYDSKKEAINAWNEKYGK